MNSHEVQPTEDRFAYLKEEAGDNYGLYNRLRGLAIAKEQLDDNPDDEGAQTLYDTMAKEVDDYRRDSH